MKAKIKISANQAQLNVVGFLSSFVTLVSLSHFSFVSTCVYPGERRRVARPHSHWRGGRGFNGPHSHWRGGRGEAPPGGRGRFHFSAGFFLQQRFSSAVLSSTLYTSHWRGGSFARPGASILVVARVSGLVRAKASRASAGPSWSRLTSAASCS